MIERLFPDKHIKKVEDINLAELKKMGLKGMIIDIDNTLIDYNKNLRESTIEWINNAKKEEFKICLVSNNTKQRVTEIANKLSLEGICNATKPRRKGFIEALNKMNLKNTEIAVVGDQVFTDVYGGNRLNMFTILVEQIAIKDIWITKIKRPIEKYVLRRYNERSEKHEEKKIQWKIKSANAKKVA